MELSLQWTVSLGNWGDREKTIEASPGSLLGRGKKEERAWHTMLSFA